MPNYTDFEDGIIFTSSPTKRKVIEKLQSVFGFDFSDRSFDIATYKGSQDADAYRWFTLGLYPQINSRLTMTDFIKNKNAFYDFGWSVDGVTIDEGCEQPEFHTEPNYKKVKNV